VRFLLLVAAALAAAGLAGAVRPGTPALADPTCVTFGPVDVMGQEVVPFIQQCLPTA